MSDSQYFLESSFKVDDIVPIAAINRYFNSEKIDILINVKKIFVKLQFCTDSNIQIEIILQRKFLETLNTIYGKMENFLMENILKYCIVTNNNSATVFLQRKFNIDVRTFSQFTIARAKYSF